MTFKEQLTDIIKGYADVEHEFCYAMMYTDYDYSTFLTDHNITCKLTYSYGGEGQGDDFYAVYSFSHPDHDILFVKFQGYYASYNGADFEEWYFVTPSRQTITVYNTLED